MKQVARQSKRCVFCTHRTSAWRSSSSYAPQRRHTDTNAKNVAFEPSLSNLKSRRYRRGSSPPQNSDETKLHRRDRRNIADHNAHDSIKESELAQVVPPLSPAMRWTIRRRVSDSESATNRRSKTPDFVVWEHTLRALNDIVEGLSRSMAEGSSNIKAWGIESQEELTDWATKYEQTLLKMEGATDTESLRLWRHLRRAYNDGGLKAHLKEVEYRFFSFVVGSSFSVADINNQRKLADLRYPTEWYPATRALQRKIHLHVGPTNSGKTYQALKRLESAKSGVYAGPLRLLAHEVYSRLNAKGKSCALVTGEEQRFPEGYDQRGDEQMISCTVEMVPINTDVEVAVIDEIQMLGDEERGWAWTQALLGVKAKEIHLCGELRTVPLIEDICRSIGDELVIHEYKRLSPLKAAEKHLGSLKNLEKGDCVVVFSRVGIHAMKKEIERETGKRCAVVYGSLPPETRAQQAALFNDPDNEYDYLCASDAVGMGLNLSIKRVIFEATSKHNGKTQSTVSVPMIKQIGGRAGRFRTAHDATKALKDSDPGGLLDDAQRPTGSVGLVTTLESFDLPIVQRAMLTEPQPIVSAGIFPPNHMVARFASYFPPETPLSYILLRLAEIATTHTRYHLCRYKDHIEIADAIQPFKLTIADRLTFIVAPINFRVEGMHEVCQAFAKCLEDQSAGELLDIPELKLEILDEDGNGKEYLNRLEALHMQITLYLWLSYRFAGVFRSQALAFHVKGLLETKIDAALSKFEVTEEMKKNRLRRMKKVATLAEQQGLDGDNGQQSDNVGVEEIPTRMRTKWDSVNSKAQGMGLHQSEV